MGDVNLNAVDIACPVCASRGGHRDHSSYEHGGTVYHLMSCGTCKSLFVLEPGITDYSTHTAEDNAIRDYVELNAAVDIIGANVLSALVGRAPGRLLDIGCGFGFGADVARRLAGWDVIGVEPSSYGRLGATVLGLTMYHELIHPGHELASRKFDAIFSSEVIEHVDDPRAFLALAKSMLAPGGLLVVGTPDAASLDEAIGDSERLAVLSPGAHLFLLSQDAMRWLLKQLGFDHIEIHRRGTSMVAYASDSPLVLQPLNPIEVGRDYARDVLRDGVSDPFLNIGLTFRLFRYLIDLGDLDAAAAMVADLPSIKIDAGQTIETFDEYMASYPACAAPLIYYQAMLKLNGGHNYSAAADMFIQAYLLCGTKIRVAPSLSVVESSLLWGCLYHAAVACRAAGNASLADGLCRAVEGSDDAARTVWADLAAAQLA